MNPAVSVYIVTYLNTAKRCDVLVRTCQNVLMQRYSDFEVVVSDNCGKYSAQNALSDIEDPRLRIFRNEENVGFAGNINYCLSRCSHDVIKLMCDDDLLHPEFLAQTVPHVSDDVLVITDFEKFSPDDFPDDSFDEIADPVDRKYRAGGYGKDIWHLPYLSFPSTTIFTRKLFEDLRGYDSLSLISDWDFLIKACLKKSICHIKYPLSFMGVWQESLTEQIHVKSPYYFQAGGLYTKFSTMRNSGLGRKGRISIWKDLLKEVIFQSCRFLFHIKDPIYRGGYLKYLHEWKSCLLGRKRSSNCYIDASMAYQSK
jgi:glycosyltransferase involved in cell wall biosynthesis